MAFVFNYQLSIINYQLSIINYQLSIKNKRAKVTFFSKMSQFFLYDGYADDTDFADFHGYFF